MSHLYPISYTADADGLVKDKRYQYTYTQYVCAWPIATNTNHHLVSLTIVVQNEINRSPKFRGLSNLSSCCLKELELSMELTMRTIHRFTDGGGTVSMVQHLRDVTERTCVGSCCCFHGCSPMTCSMWNHQNKNATKETGNWEQICGQPQISAISH